MKFCDKDLHFAEKLKAEYGLLSIPALQRKLKISARAAEMLKEIIDKTGEKQHVPN
jgi:hypothetical protein